jgi:hypothetical protein
MRSAASDASFSWIACSACARALAELVLDALERGEHGLR